MLCVGCAPPPNTTPPARRNGTTNHNRTNRTIDTNTTRTTRYTVRHTAQVEQLALKFARTPMAITLAPAPQTAEMKEQDGKP